jgi:hypothetical protein
MSVLMRLAFRSLLQLERARPIRSCLRFYVLFSKASEPALSHFLLTDFCFRCSAQVAVISGCWLAFSYQGGAGGKHLSRCCACTTASRIRGRAKLFWQIGFFSFPPCPQPVQHVRLHQLSMWKCVSAHKSLQANVLKHSEHRGEKNKGGNERRTHLYIDVVTGNAGSQ